MTDTALKWKRDGRTMVGGGAVAACVGVAVVGGVVLPILMALLPASFVLQATLFLFQQRKWRKQPPLADDRVEVKSLKALKDRKYDVVVLGATGYTGGWAVRYLKERYGVNGAVKWAIAGRREEALEALKERLGLEGIDVIVCDTSAPETLHNLVSDTRSVATFAGPFDLYGTQVVRFCASYGTHYADSTGEFEWVREMIERFSPICRETKARIVSFCGCDSVPWDILTMKLAEKIKKDHDSDLASVTFWDYGRGHVSGGTLATLFNEMLKVERYVHTTQFDVLGLETDDTESTHRFKVDNVIGVVYSRDEKKWAIPTPLSYGNALTTKRSNALRKYGTRVVYREGMLCKSLPDAVLTVLSFIAFFLAIMNPILRYLIRRFLLPKPGQGPAAESMVGNFLEVRGFGVGENGSRAAATIYFPKDAGYTETGRMVVESALALALSDPKLLPGDVGGVFSPAAGIGQPLLDRLCAAGTEFTFDE